MSSSSDEPSGPPLVHYVTHPQVAIDPAVPVPRWGLSDLGRERTRRAAGCRWTAHAGRIFASEEVKAIETAALIAEPLGLAIEIRRRMHENDRSATGFLPPPLFEATADRFFAAPDLSIDGWERAIDAQARIVAAVTAAIDEEPGEGDLIFIGHGAVGTLLFCKLAGLPIDRRHDQPTGGGNRFAFERASGRVLHGWVPFDRDD